MAVDVSPREAIGAICHVVPEHELGLYAVDGIAPRVAAYPKTAEQVAAIVQVAAGQKWAVAPRGGGTLMELGGIPRAVDVVVCTTDMNQIVEYEPADLTCTVQAGMRLSDLQARLSEHCQFLALDPPLPERATIGGIVAANGSGPLRLRYGTCRDLLIGIRVVNPDGNITKGGGKVVKNVSGYDMCKLYTNSLGTIGIIVEATFKLWPLPALESTVVASYPTLEKAYATARQVHRSALPVRACELLTPAASDGRGYLVAVWVGGERAALERQNEELASLCSAGYAPKTKRSIELMDGERMQAFWRRVESFGRDGAATIAKISVLPSRTGELLAQLPE
ncbi:MAG: FAD-binding oxidoreductase, partial [Chloroflexota bacterium]|nr:FAD-binding oxidoreductase [Chloroflexota bacterium]